MLSLFSQSAEPLAETRRVKKSSSKAAVFTSLIVLCTASITMVNATSLSCNDIDANHLSATYTVKHPSGQQSTMTLLRNNHQVIYQRSPVSFEMWNKQGEYVRYFPNEQRSISYRKGDLLSLNIHFDFEQLNHLVSTNVLNQLSLSEQTSQAFADERENQIAALGCIDTNRYQTALHHSQLKLVWADKIALPVAMDVTANIEQDSNKVSYQLVALKALSNDDFTSLISGYRDMDFADVGDNESDPFIAKMIHQGFIQHGSSGFYDSQGNQLSGGESGHQH